MGAIPWDVGFERYSLNSDSVPKLWRDVKKISLRGGHHCPAFSP